MPAPKADSVNAGSAVAGWTASDVVVPPVVGWAASDVVLPPVVAIRGAVVGLALDRHAETRRPIHDIVKTILANEKRNGEMGVLFSISRV